MSQNTAQTVLIAVTAVGVVIWLISLWFLVSSYRRGRTEQPVDHFAHSEQLPPNWFLGSVEVEGQPHTLADKTAAILVRQSPGSVKILEKTKDRLTFESVGPILVGQPRRGQLRFTAQGSGHTRIDFAIEPPAHPWMLWLGIGFQLCGLLALVVGGWVIYEYCLPSPHPKIRAQAVQIVQVVHFLWPPFLFAGLYRQRNRAATEGFEILLRNLPFFAS
jgi:hypothetical protein